MTGKERIERLQKRWKIFKTSRGFHNILLYGVFVAIAALFWLVMALNDSIEESVDVGIRIYNVPDSVTFIDDPPAEMRISVSGKGTSLLQTCLLRRPTVNINFKDYADRGVFRLPASSMIGLLKSTFGTSVDISSYSIDSLRLQYTTSPGRRVPLVLNANVSAADGFVIAGKLRCSNPAVTIYCASPDNDTISRVYTEKFVKRGLNTSEQVEVKIRPMPGFKVVPAKVTVTIPVETLVKKKSTIAVRVINVPSGESLLIFPANVDVTYFVPMSRFNEADTDINVVADYNDLASHRSGKLPVRIGSHGSGYVNVTLLTDSVEYTIVR